MVKYWVYEHDTVQCSALTECSKTMISIQDLKPPPPKKKMIFIFENCVWISNCHYKSSATTWKVFSKIFTPYTLNEHKRTNIYKTKIYFYLICNVKQKQYMCDTKDIQKHLIKICLSCLFIYSAYIHVAYLHCMYMINYIEMHSEYV